jgi:hypothetical protein
MATIPKANTRIDVLQTPRSKTIPPVRGRTVIDAGFFLPGSHNLLGKTCRMMTVKYLPDCAESREIAGLSMA